MKTISSALSDHLSDDVTLLVTCWKLVLENGDVLGFTEHVTDLVIDGVTYGAVSGITPSSLSSSEDLGVDNLDVQGVLDSSSISDSDILTGMFDFAEIYIFLVNYADLSQGIIKLQHGILGEVSVGRTAYVAEMRSLSQKYTKNVGEVFTMTCRADLGDERCKVTLEPSTWTSSVVASANTTLVRPTTENMHHYYATTTGTTGTAEPTWTASTVSDGSVIWQAYTATLARGYYGDPNTPENNLITVGSGKDYATIQAAHNAVTTVDGDTLLIDPGTYEIDGFQVTKRIHLKNAGTSWAKDTVRLEAAGGTSYYTLFYYLANQASWKDIWIEGITIAAPARNGIAASCVGAGMGQRCALRMNRCYMDAVNKHCLNFYKKSYTAHRYYFSNCDFATTANVQSFIGFWDAYDNVVDVSGCVFYEPSPIDCYNCTGFSTSGWDYVWSSNPTFGYGIAYGNEYLSRGGVFQFHVNDLSSAGGSGYFNGGYLLGTSGANAGVGREVAVSKGDSILSFKLPFPFEWAENDTFIVTRKCGKTPTDCNGFSPQTGGNIVNFRGEPFIPGRDEISKYGNR